MSLNISQSRFEFALIASFSPQIYPVDWRSRFIDATATKRKLSGRKDQTSEQVVAIYRELCQTTKALFSSLMSNAHSNLLESLLFRNCSRPVITMTNIKLINYCHTRPQLTNPTQSISASAEELGPPVALFSRTRPAVRPP